MRDRRNRAVQLRRFGGSDELEVVDASLPTGGSGQVRVRVLASGLEYTDDVIRRHLYPLNDAPPATSRGDRSARRRRERVSTWRLCGPI